MANEQIEAGQRVRCSNITHAEAMQVRCAPYTMHLPPENDTNDTVMNREHEALPSSACEKASATTVKHFRAARFSSHRLLPCIIALTSEAATDGSGSLYNDAGIVLSHVIKPGSPHDTS